MPSKYEEYELNTLLYDIKENGFIYISKYKMWRLLGKGSGAAGTWKDLLDIWVEHHADNKRNDLHAFEYGGRYFISTMKTARMREWAGEV